MRLKARNRIVTGALVLLVLLVAIGALLSGAPPARAAEPFTLEGRDAPVGLATDHERDRYWLLDRASGRLQLTAVGADGVVQGRMTSRDTLSNARALAFWDGEAWVGDIGGSRESVVVLNVIEPWPGTEILNALPHELTYPDGAHDAAALLVDGDHRVHVVTTGEGAGIYRAPTDPSTEGPSALERIADAPADVTDATVLLDGRWVLRTPTRVLTLDPGTHATLGEAEVTVEERGQVVTQALDTREVLTALGPAGEVTALAIPGPVPTTTPKPRPTRTAVVPVAADDEPDPTRRFEQTGTTMALTAALGLAGLAALVVLFRR
ncbi:MAG TPA: hypothetical protein GXZ45_00845 [Propionibacterium sp.]|nr:hypothetical protein [Propionibacterium sp.]